MITVILNDGRRVEYPLAALNSVQNMLGDRIIDIEFPTEDDEFNLPDVEVLESPKPTKPVFKEIGEQTKKSRNKAK